MTSPYQTQIPRSKRLLIYYYFCCWYWSRIWSVLFTIGGIWRKYV